MLRSFARQDVFVGIALRVLSGALFVVMSACVRALSGSVPLGQIVFFRSAVAMLPLVLFLWWQNQWPHGLRTSRPGAHALRSMLGCTAMFTSFATLAYLPLAEAQVLGFLAPIVLVILGTLVLRESQRAAKWLAVIIGFAGVVIMAWPRLQVSGLRSGEAVGVALGVATAILTAFALMQVRRLAQTETTGAIAFYFALVSTLCGLATLPLGWALPAGRDLALLLASGLLGGLAHIAMTVSFQRAEASTLAPFEYLTILWAVGLGLAVFGEMPDASFALATGLVIIAAALVTRDEARRARLPAPQRA